MKKVNRINELKQEILRLESDQEFTKLRLNTVLGDTMEQLNPLQMLKLSLNDSGNSKILKSEILGATAGSTIGAVAKFLLVGNSKNPLRIVIGNLAQVGLSVLVAKNPKTIAMVTTGIIGMIKNYAENVLEKHPVR